MTEPLFKLGQHVRPKRTFPGGRDATDYLILRVLPPSNDGMPLYRIKDTELGRERVVSEYEISKVLELRH